MACRQTWPFQIGVKVGTTQKLPGGLKGLVVFFCLVVVVVVVVVFLLLLPVVIE